MSLLFVTRCARGPLGQSRPIDARRRPWVRVWSALCLAAIALAATRTATAQITSLADDIIIITQGVDKQEQMKADAHLANPAGSGGNPFGYSPGGGDIRLGPRGVPAPGSGAGRVQSDVLQAAAEEAQNRPTEVLRFTQERIPVPGKPPVGAAMALPDDETEDEGPTSGLTLDDAIGQLVRMNYDLRH